MFRSERRFKVWDYHVSHSRLLIRSDRLSIFAFNIDIIFYNVWAFDGFVGFNSIEVSTLDEELIDHERYGELVQSKNLKVFRLKDGDKEHTVVASWYKVFENDVDSMVSSIDYTIEIDSNREIARGGFD